MSSDGVSSGVPDRAAAEKPPWLRSWESLRLRVRLSEGATRRFLAPPDKARLVGGATGQESQGTNWWESNTTILHIKTQNHTSINLSLYIPVLVQTDSLSPVLAQKKCFRVFAGSKQVWSQGYLVAGRLPMDSVPPLDSRNPQEEAWTPRNNKYRNFTQTWMMNMSVWNDSGQDEQHQLWPGEVFILPLLSQLHVLDIVGS